jgi:hypothetical protein
MEGLPPSMTLTPQLTFYPRPCCRPRRLMSRMCRNDHEWLGAYAATELNPNLLSNSLRRRRASPIVSRRVNIPPGWRRSNDVTCNRFHTLSVSPDLTTRRADPRRYHRCWCHCGLGSARCGHSGVMSWLGFWGCRSSYWLGGLWSPCFRLRSPFVLVLGCCSFFFRRLLPL